MGSTVVFNKLIQQVFADLDSADAFCDAIKTNRHCGTHHTELDALQESLKAGMGSLKSAADSAAASSPSAEDLSGAEDVVAGYAKELKHICHKLEKISKAHHSHHHHVEHPHFRDLRLKWEDALKGILELLGGLQGTEELEVVEVEVEEKSKGKEVEKKEDEGEEVKEVEKKLAEVKIVEVETKETVEVK